MAHTSTTTVTVPKCHVEAIAIKTTSGPAAGPSSGPRWKLHAVRAYLTADLRIHVQSTADLLSTSSKASFVTSLRKPFNRKCVYLTASDLRLDYGPFGFPWHDDLSSPEVREAIIHHYKLMDGLMDDYELLTVYHGTDGESIDSIMSTRLRTGPEPAMLGHGVYFGSFWKACRYAMYKNTRSWADCKFREIGCILRCVIRVHRDQWLKLPSKDHTCKCFKCTNRIRCASSEGERDHRTRVASLCDHESSWVSAYDMISIEDTLGTMTHGETCIKDSKVRDLVVMLDFGVLDPSTRSDPYDPERKDHRIQIGDDS